MVVGVHDGVVLLVLAAVQESAEGIPVQNRKRREKDIPVDAQECGEGLCASRDDEIGDDESIGGEMHLPIEGGRVVMERDNEMGVRKWKRRMLNAIDTPSRIFCAKRPLPLHRQVRTRISSASKAMRARVEQC